MSVLLYSGGIRLIFNGTNLDAVQQPMLEVNDQDYLDIVNVGEGTPNWYNVCVICALL